MQISDMGHFSKDRRSNKLDIGTKIEMCTQTCSVDPVFTCGGPSVWHHRVYTLKKWFVGVNFLYGYTRVSAVHAVAEQWILAAARESVKTKPPIRAHTDNGDACWKSFLCTRTPSAI